MNGQQPQKGKNLAQELPRSGYDRRGALEQLMCRCVPSFEQLTRLIIV
jgi:hypothetical protein